MPPRTAEISSIISDDDRLVQMWLHGASPNTAKAYRRDVAAFRLSVARPLVEVTLEDLQSWFDGLPGAEATRRRKLASVKSALAFGARMRLLPQDVGAALRMSRGKDALNERILTEEDVLRLIEQEPDARRQAFLRVLYLLGLRISEACSLTWRDMTRRQQGGLATVFGKGGKTRIVSVPAKLWKELVALRVDGRPNAPVVPGHDGGPVHLKAADRLVKRAARRAGLPACVSAHWLRHACASHAMDNGAPAHVVQQQLGHASLATTTRYLHVRQGEGTGNYLKG